MFRRAFRRKNGLSFWRKALRFLHGDRIFARLMLNGFEGSVMRYFVIFVGLLACAVTNAQPWQWQQLPGDYYNPTGFPNPPAFGYPTPFTAELGDFNGDGVDEYICLEGSNQITAAVRVPGELRWVTSTFTQQLTDGSPCRGLLAIHLDFDGCEELIVFCDTVLAWDVPSTDPWTFTPLLPFPNFLIFPQEASKVVFGDFNGSGTYQAVALDPFLSHHRRGLGV
jgi:hypothetical protein